MVTGKAHSEEDRAASGRVTSPKELTAIQEEVAALKRRQSALEDDLLERMEQRETLEAELAELDSRREAITAEQAEVTRDRDAALVEIDPTSPPSRRAADEVAPRVDGRAAGPLRPGPQAPGRGRGGRPGRQHLPGLPGVDLPGRAGRAPQAAGRDRQALRELPPDPGGRVSRRRGGRLDRRGGAGQPGPGRLRGGRHHPRRRGPGPAGRGHRLGDQQRGRVPRRDRRPPAGPGPGGAAGPGPGRLAAGRQPAEGPVEGEERRTCGCCGPRRAGWPASSSGSPGSTCRGSATGAPTPSPTRRWTPRGWSSARSRVCREPDRNRSPFRNPNLAYLRFMQVVLSSGRSNPDNAGAPGKLLGPDSYVTRGLYGVRDPRRLRCRRGR